MALTQFPLNSTDGITASTSSTGAQQITLNGGSAIYSSAAAFSGSTGLSITSVANSLAIARFQTAQPALSMAVTFGVTLPSTDLPSGANLIFATIRQSVGGPFVRFIWNAARSVSLQIVASSTTLPLLTGQAPGTKLRFGGTFTVDTASTGQYVLNVYNGQSTTPLNSTPFSSATANLGTSAITGGDFGVVSSDIAAAVTVGVDDVQLNDGSSTEIGPFQLVTDSEGNADLVWTGVQWR